VWLPRGFFVVKKEIERCLKKKGWGLLPFGKEFVPVFLVVDGESYIVKERKERRAAVWCLSVRSCVDGWAGWLSGWLNE
jgi:hypothetical protein